MIPRSSILTIVCLSLAPLAAEAESVISYVVDLRQPAEHMIEVGAVYPTGGAEELELFMAVWTPGSYLVREYSRQLEGITAADAAGTELEVVKTRKNRWRVSTGGASRIVVRYRLYCREMSVRTNWVETDWAMLNGAPTFLSPVGAGALPHDVQLLMPEDWRESVTALEPLAGGDPHRYRAASYGKLVDSPIIAGNPTVFEFEAGGARHRIANLGGGEIWDGERAAKDVARIVQAQQEFWGVVPYEDYTFLNVISESGGGLEHSGSTLLMTSRWKTRTRKAYEGWLGLVSHEFFHTWNVKRLRPRALGPFDYENEVYTRDLWIVEGFTSYYDDLLLYRAGLISGRDYMNLLAGNIRSLQDTPGRLVRALSLTSYDAWIKHYRKDENTKNTSVSYYTKGAVVAWLLDIEIRRATEGAASLDDVMRLAYERYAGEQGYTSRQFRDTASEVAGTDLSEFFARAVDSTQDLDYQPALDWLGLRFRPVRPPEPGKGRAWLGVAVTQSEGRLVVTGVTRGTPAHEAGLNVDDEILAIDDYRVLSWSSRLAQYRPGTEATLLIARREELMRIPVTFAAQPPPRWQLELDRGPTPTQREHREAWLSGER